MTIGKAVASIDDGVFDGCGKLKQINVDPANMFYSSDKGVLFDKSKVSLLLYPCGKDEKVYDIPSSVTNIDISLCCNTNIAEIRVDSGNQSFVSESGVLFDKNKTRLIRYPVGKSNTEYAVIESVTVIDSYAFNNCSNLQAISIPASVTEIGKSCFLKCENLKKVEIMGGVQKIGVGAFMGTKISSMNIPESVTTIGNYAFAFCSELESISIPSKTVEIGESILTGCSALERITVAPNNEKYSSDAQGAFYNKDKSKLIRLPQMLESYYMPDTVEEIANEFSGDMGFSGVSCCEGLKEFIVGEGNESFSSDSQGALYNKDKTELVQYPCASPAKTYILPSSVTEVISNGSVGFSLCPNLERIEVETGNSYFWNDENGVLFKEDEQGRSLAKIPGNAQMTFYRIPENVIHAMPYAISNVRNIKRVHLSELGGGEAIMAIYNYDMVAVSLMGVLNPTLSSAEDEEGTDLKSSALLSVCTEKDTLDMDLKEFLTYIGINFELCDGNHTEHKHSPKTVTVPATCTTDGMEYEVCSDCGEIIGTPTVIKAKGHTEVKDIAVKPTCTATGLTEGAHCSVCNTIIKKQEVIPATGHTEVKDIAVKPTCTATGLTEGVHCSVCNTIIKKQEVIPATGHTSGDWIVVTEPTSDTDGKRVKKCTVCGTILSEEILPKLTVAVDEKTGIELDYSGGDYSGKVELSVEETFDGAAFNLVNTQFNVSQSFIYDIKMTVDGVETQPTGTVKVRIPLPEGFDPARTFVYHVDTETGKVVKMAATYKDGYLEFETDHFSYYAVVEEAKPCKLSINTPSTTTVSYGFTLNLHANVTDLPEGARIVWSMDGSGFELIPSADGMTCGVKSVSKGSATITAKVVDKKGNAVKDANGSEIAASQQLTSKAGFFQKLAAFFKKLFGSNMIIPYALEWIIK